MVKNRINQIALLAGLLLLSFQSAHAQLGVTASSNATQLVQALMGPGITVSNITMNCPAGAAGTFNGSATNLGINSGVLLTTGSVAIAAQPNLAGSSGVNNGGAGDAQLTALGGDPTFDACGLEFDFVAFCDTISIAYVFASDEYDEYVCGSVNDVFGFFLTGPGYANTNIALVPGTGVPVTINTVNNGSIGAFGFPGAHCNTSNSAYYTSNAGGTTHEYDGQTVRMLARATVVPCATYHVKLVVADGGDGVYDSGVFLEQNGINCNATFVDISSGLNQASATSAIEGCLNGFFTLHRDGDSTVPYTINYTVGGTATPGVDFGPLSGSATFNVNQSTVTIPIIPISDGLTEGTENVYIIVYDTVCGVADQDTAFLNIDDNLVVSAGANTSACANSPAQLGAPTVSGYTYSWTPITGLNNSTIANPTVTLGTPGTYQYIVQANNGFGCIGRDTVQVVINNQPTSTFNLSPVACVFENATLTYTGNAGVGAQFNWNFSGATVLSGSGAGPYTLEWATAGTQTVTLQVIEGPCTSSVGSANILVGSMPIISPTGQNVSCFGANDGNIFTNPSGGTPNYSFLWSNSAITQDLTNIGPGTYSVTLTDNLGCADTATFSITSPNQINLTFDLIQDVSCNGANDGCIAITASGGQGNFSYLWNSGQTTDSICGLAAGTYIITVTDTVYSSGIVNQVYFEDFDGSHGWTLNTPTGVNGTDPNFWLVEDNEGGVAVGGCGVANNGDSTLHITSVFNPTGGAAYDAGGLCGILFCPETNMRAESPSINATGQNNLSLSFDFISMGDGLIDNASVLYFDGAVWNTLTASIKSTVCGGGQGLWTSYTAALPASANNNPNIRVGFNWTNNDDGVGTDPSVAINNVSIITSLAPTFTLCTVVDTAEILEPAPLALNMSSVDVLCFGDSTGCVTAAASGGNGNFTYLWNTGDTTSTVCGLPAGTYIVTLTDTVAGGGGGSQNVVVFDEDFDGPNAGTGWTLNVPTGPNGTDPNFWLVEDNEGGVAVGGCGVANNGDSTLHITSVFNPTGGAAYDAGGLCGILFCPETNSRSESPVFSTVGATSATLSFDFISMGDALIDNASILYNDGLGWQVLSPSIKSLVCGGGQGLWQAASFALPASCVNNPTVRIGFNWTNNDDGVGTDPSVAINNVEVSALILGGGGGGNCTLVDTVVVSQPTALVATIQGYDVTCGGAADGAADVDVSGGTPIYTYLWSNSAVTDSIFGISGGTYSVTFTDDNGCSDSLSILINEPPLIVPSYIISNVLCNGDTSGCVSVSAVGGPGGNFVFDWSTGATGNMICGLGAGTYYVTITDTTGAGGVQNFTLYSEDFDGANAGAGWVLNVPTGPNGTDPNFWLVEDNEGGVAPGGCGVANNGDSTLHITSVFNPTGGAAYDAGGLCGILFCPETNSRSESPVFSTVGFTNATLNFDFISMGDALIDNASVLYNDGLGWQVLSPSIKSLVCGGGQGLWQAASFALPASCINNPTVRIGFNWTNNDDGVGTDPSVAINNIEVISQQLLPGGVVCSIVDSVTITEPAALTHLTSSTADPCSSGTGTATVVPAGGVGGYTYLWNTVPAQAGATATGLLPGNYIVTVTDANLCTDTAHVAVLNIPGPSISIANTADVSCFGGNDGVAIASVSGGTPTVNVSWNTIPPQTGLTATNLSAGNYLAIAVDGNGCRDTAQATINQPALLTVTTSGNNAICNLPNGSATANVAGGTLAYNYVWSNNQSTPTIGGLAAGTYGVTITDAQGCQATSSVVILQEGSPTPSLVSQTDVNCFGGSDGAATVSASGGVGPYTYAWGTFPQQTGPTATNLAAGTYTVTVTDDNSCTGMLNVTIGQPSALAATSIATDVSCWASGNPNGTIGVITSGGTPGYTYAWSTAPVQTTQYATGLAPGIYSVSITDAHGCVLTVRDTVNLQPSPSVVAGPDASFCEGEGGAQIFASPSGGTPGYYFQWWCDSTNTFCGLDSINDNDPIANPTVSTWYYVQVIDTNGCRSNVDSLLVIVLPKPLVNAGPDQFICGDSAPCVVLTPTIAGAAGPYTYLWSPSTGLNDSTIMNPCARPDTTTIYALVVTAGNGCTSDFTTTDTVSTVTVHVNPIPIADAGPDVDLCLGDSTVLQGIGYGAGPVYEFEWSPGDGLSDSLITNPVASPSATTNYSLVVWSNGCPSYADSVEVRVHTLPTVDAGWDREICYGGTAPLDAQASGDSTASYAFAWTPGLSLSDSTTEDPAASPLETTTYYVQAISSYGCKSTPDSATVYVIPTPIADAGPNLFICQGDTTTLLGAFSYMNPDTAPASQIYYSWTPGSTLSDTTLLQPEAWTSNSIWYHLEIRYRTCMTEDSVLVTVGPAALAMAEADTVVICGQDSVQLLSTGSIGTNLNWWPSAGLDNPTDPNPMAAPDSTTTYYLAIGQGGCMDTAAVTVQVIPSPIAAYLSSLPDGCAPHEVNFVDASQGAVNYIWNFGDGSPVYNATQPTHTYATPGSYTVTLIAQSSGACADTISDLIVTVYDSAQAEFVSNPEFPVELSVPVTEVAFEDRSVNAVSWTWDFGDGIRSDEVNPIHNYETPGTYFVTLVVENALGCISRVTHGPYIVLLPDLFIPNVFSPNDDGINDVFFVDYTGSQPYEIQVYDRWGDLQYASKVKVDGWDGNNAKGNPVPDGVYYYKVNVGNREFVGNVTLMR